MSIFLPELVQPLALIVGYVVILPLVVFLLMKSYLEKRPYTFHQPDITKHPKFRKEKFLNKDLFIAIFFASVGIYLGLSLLLPIGARFTPLQLYFSFIITWGIVLGVVYFAYSKVRGKLELRDEIAKIESEFPEALVLIGTRLSLGIPLENVLDKTIPKIKHLKVSGFFKNIVHNIRILNMNFEQAIFDKERGAIIFYPSTILTAIMKAITDIYAKGAEIVSKTMVTVSQFLKNVHSVEESLRDMLSEVTSSIHLQMLLLAPLSAGVVVALAAIIVEMIMILGSAAKLYESIAGYGALSAAGGGILAGFINTEKIIPVHVLQVTIGIYLVEIVALMASFTSRIENGEESILKMRLIARMVLLAALIYTVVTVGLYSTISSMLAKFFVKT
jgi:hypothetical protein